ncbi:hypothetical protein CEXT_407431 [Caerostris extrusa]|uniref:Uncharacterized protein n=1 Tax=Caerostris extrusa TaxID=172846 RepID=A0AAV4QXM3_CAEEX|nr:hypothetical protein CEXT_407431 [Caerostris extrusa]
MPKFRSTTEFCGALGKGDSTRARRFLFKYYNSLKFQTLPYARHEFFGFGAAVPCRSSPTPIQPFQAHIKPHVYYCFPILLKNKIWQLF